MFAFTNATILFLHDPRCQFHQRSTSSFYVCRSGKRKKDLQIDSLFYDFEICDRKSCT